jgi:hypothetical protein
MALDTLDGNRRLLQNAQLVPRKGTRPLPTFTLHAIEGGELAIGQHFELTLEKIDPLPAGGIVAYNQEGEI